MTTELEIITPNLRGSCMTVGNRLHGLFKVTGRKLDAKNNAWLQVRTARPGDGAAEPTDA